MKKTSNEPPIRSPVVAKISERLEEDPEVIDYYLWRYFGMWGEEKLQAMFRFVAKCEQEGDQHLVRSTLLHDFSIDKNGKREPITGSF